MGDWVAPGEPAAVRILARTPAEWAQRRPDILRRAQLVTGPLPAVGRDLPLNPEVLETVDFPAYTRLKVAYQGEPDDRLTASLLLPKKAGRLPAVLCLHQTFNYGKAEPAGLLGDPNLFYAKELAERGFVTLAPDYWPFGDYLGKPYDPYRAGYASAVMKGVWNHIRALDYLAARPEVDAARIGCIGHSLGGHNALWLGGVRRPGAGLRDQLRLQHLGVICGGILLRRGPAEFCDGVLHAPHRHGLRQRFPADALRLRRDPGHPGPAAGLHQRPEE